MKKWIFKRILPSLAVLFLGLYLFFEPLKNALIFYFLEDYLGDLPAYTHEMGEMQTYSVQMQDGTQLDTRVYFP